MPGTVSLMLKLLLTFAESKRGITFVARCSPVQKDIKNAQFISTYKIVIRTTVSLLKDIPLSCSVNNVLPNVMKLMFIPLISLTKQKMK